LAAARLFAAAIICICSSAWHNPAGISGEEFCRRPGGIVSKRVLVALGTSSLSPTRDRSHNAYLLLWDGEGFLFDPGEGTQRQLILANVSASAIHHICISHFHGDHCLGLAGIVQRLSLDRCDHAVHLYYPESGQEYIERLCHAAIFNSQVVVQHHPIPEGNRGMIELWRTEDYGLCCLPLAHSVPTFGFRLEETERRRFIPEKLAAMGVHGTMVGELRRKGELTVQGKTVRLDEVSVRRRGSSFAFIMDTRPCPEAVALGRDADLLLMEATYTSEHEELAVAYLHSTAVDAARTALAAGARSLLLGHFSQRYGDTDQHLREAAAIFPEVQALRDLDRVEIPRMY